MNDNAERRKAALADRYRIERALGAGGMATVYLAHDLRREMNRPSTPSLKRGVHEWYALSVKRANP